jgi:hypothetical protein
VSVLSTANEEEVYFRPTKEEQADQDLCQHFPNVHLGSKSSYLVLLEGEEVMEHTVRGGGSRDTILIRAVFCVVRKCGLK